MNTENEEPKKEQENVPQSQPEEVTNRPEIDETKQPVSPLPESSPSGKKNEKVSGARILRDMVGGSLGIRRWPEIREKLNEIEDILEEEYLKRGTEENK